jgi:hypothetical protein
VEFRYTERHRDGTEVYGEEQKIQLNSLSISVYPPCFSVFQPPAEQLQKTNDNCNNLCTSVDSRERLNSYSNRM